MSDFEKLRNAILQEAEDKAQAIINEGQLEAQALMDEAQRETQEFKRDGEEDAREKAEDLKNRMLAAAQRELETQVLETKHSQAAVIFENIRETVLTMSAREYQEFITGLVMKEELSKGNYELVISERDTDRITPEFVKELNAKLKEKGASLSFSGNTAKIAGGVILKAADVEENLSIDSLLRMRKDTLVQEAMASLFPGTDRESPKDSGAPEEDRESPEDSEDTVEEERSET